MFFSFVLCLPLRLPAQRDAKALFKAKCAVCHGENGDAASLVAQRLKLRDFRSGDVQKQTDARLSTILHCGKGNMPGYQDRLTDDQITLLVGYLRTLAASKRP